MAWQKDFNGRRFEMVSTRTGKVWVVEAYEQNAEARALGASARAEQAGKKPLGNVAWMASILSGTDKPRIVKIRDGKLTDEGRRAWWRSSERAMAACEALDRRGEG